MERLANTNRSVCARVRARRCSSVARKSRRSTGWSVRSRNFVKESWPSPRMRKALAIASRA
jgi:hypothetical protein